MTELSSLIARLERGIARGASYVQTIRHPQLLVSSLQELNNLIGNDKVKDSVATQVSHLIMVKRRALASPEIKEDEVMLNTVLYGPPGVGKTLVGAKLAKIWYSLGYLDGSKNVREKKTEIGDLIKDLFKDGSGTTSDDTDDTTVTWFIMLLFITLLIAALSIAWSFYSRFGGYLTIAAIVIVVIIIVITGFYISGSLNNTNSNDTTNNKNSKDAKNSKNSKGNQYKDSSKPTSGLNNDDTSVENLDDTQHNNNPPITYATVSDDDVIKVVTRADFVDKYVGWSDKKTLKLLNENLGKVLFVDEAYSLVTDMHDSFGIEVLTTINLFISQHPTEIIIVFAGYKDLMEAGLFSFQPGLRRRFMWQFDCNGYSERQLFEIFKMQLTKKGWGLTDVDTTRLLFDDNADAFPAFGGDTERLTFFSELEHSRDFIGNETGMHINKLSPDHIRRGIIKLRENNIHDTPDGESVNPVANMMKLFRNGKSSNNKSTRRQEASELSFMSDGSIPPSAEFDMMEIIRNSAIDRPRR